MIDELRMIALFYTNKTSDNYICYSTMYKKVLDYIFFNNSEGPFNIYGCLEFPLTFIHRPYHPH